MNISSVKTITISDLIQWQRKGELALSPKYQRNSVWNENAKSYLIDTIVRGLPIPPIFMRQTIDVPTMTTFREIIDGQQRVRTIISFVIEQAFPIKKTHNRELGGFFFRDLNEEQQKNLLGYEISAEVVTEQEDSVIYDMFARLNSNNVVLNKQEIRNALYWGDFKVLVYRLSKKCRDFFGKETFFNDKDFSRMKDSELVNSMIILILDGIITETPKIIDIYYEQYDKENLNVEEVEHKFDSTISLLKDVYDYFNQDMGVFQNKNYFFTLYSVVYHQMFGIKNFDAQRLEPLSEGEIGKNRNVLTDAIQSLLSELTYSSISKELDCFIKNHKSRTTNKPERIERIMFLNTFICKNVNKN